MTYFDKTNAMTVIKNARYCFICLFVLGCLGVIFIENSYIILNMSKTELQIDFRLAMTNEIHNT